MRTAFTWIVLVSVMFLFLGSGIWVAISLLAVGYVALEFFTPAPAGSLLASTIWDASWNWALTALPLFIWMGEILFRSRLSEDMFKGLAPWLSWLPGRLLHVNIVGCGVMAAVAGSSAVTCATVGRMSIPQALWFARQVAQTGLGVWKPPVIRIGNQARAIVKSPCASVVSSFAGKFAGSHSMS